MRNPPHSTCQWFQWEIVNPASGKVSTLEQPRKPTLSIIAKRLRKKCLLYNKVVLFFWDIVFVV